MNQIWQPENSGRRESPVADNAAASSCGILERDNAFVPVVFPPAYDDVVTPVPHVVLTCSPYDEDGDE